MSRTRHPKAADIVPTTTRQAPRTALTKGPHAGGYSRGTFDAPSNAGGHGWSTWLRDYNGYAKQRKRRRQRTILKRNGRRVDRRKANAAIKDTE